MNIYSIVRQTKDKNFDGQFYFAVKTTGIFCRPSCPCPVAKEENVTYYDHVEEAIADGYRPCKRCQPDVFMEHYQNNMAGISILKESLKLIHGGFLLEHTLDELAETLFVSLRHLRQLYHEHIGTSPIKVSMFYKAIMASKQLKASKSSVTDIALSSGFGSTRQFNEVFKKATDMSPTAYRKSKHPLPKIVLQVPYDDDFNFHHLLSFLPYRMTKGVEVIDDVSYGRSFRLPLGKGYLFVKDNTGELIVELHTEEVTVIYEVYQKVLELFDLKTDFNPIRKRFETDDILKGGLINGQVPRLPKAFNSFELLIRAIINQQISIKATTTYMKRVVEKSAIKTPKGYPEGMAYYFPTSEELIEVPLDDIGLTNTRQQTLLNMMEALNKNEVSLSINQPFETFQKKMIQIKGIGNWTINYVALRGLGMVDSFPAKDLGVIKALGTKKEKELIGIAEQWRPYRGYATLCLWHKE